MIAKAKNNFRITLIIIVISAGLWSVNPYNSYGLDAEKRTRFMMDTYVSIYALGPKQISSKAIDSALDRMQEIDVKFNPLDPKSPIYAFNQRGEPISDPEIIGLIRIALKVSEETGGAFDITVEPLLELWGFYQKAFRVPGEQEIKDCLKRTGYRHLRLKEGRLEKDSQEIKIDLGGIAKGYALIEAAKVLKAKGVRSAVIDAGGDVYALGRNIDALWKIGITDPRGKDREDLLGYVEAQDESVMGSGDYERFFIKDGKRYHHIFNPKTGYPTEGVTGVTLIYPDPVAAQAWAKIPFILGARKGLEMLEKISGMKAIIVTDSGERLYSQGMKQRLKVIPENN